MSIFPNLLCYFQYFFRSNLCWLLNIHTLYYQFEWSQKLRIFSLYQDFHFRTLNVMCRGSSVSIVCDYGLDDQGFDPRQGQRTFLLAPASRPALGYTQPPIQWVPGLLSLWVKRGRGVMLTTHPHLVPRLSMSRSYTSSPPRCLHGV
jgi:hypothetical protein